MPKKHPIALQLYSVRNQCAEDFLGTIAKVAEMGYNGVEFAGYHGHEAEDIRMTLDAAGLKAEGTHTAIDQLSDENFAATVELHQTLGCHWVIIPWLPEHMRSSHEACVDTGRRLTEISEKLGKHNMKLGFHCHEGDMKPLDGGVSAWYVLANNTPKSFLMQYDTANGMAGGADPVEPLIELPGRGSSVHLKGWKNGPAIIGQDDVPWMKVFEACDNHAGTEWYVVEHEDESVMPALEAVELCLKNVKSMIG